MNESNLRRLMESRYPNSLTLLDVLKDEIILENLEKFYVPEAEIRDCIFIKKDASIAITDEGPKRIRFIYLNQHGKNVTEADSSYIQIPLSCKGFLARLSISRNNYTSENLKLDYLVDISKIRYTIESVMMREDTVITLQDILKFENMEFSNYSKLDFDVYLKEFILNKHLLFIRYFR